MVAVVQRVSRASVTVDNSVLGKIGTGLLVLVGAENGDTQTDAELLAAKISKLRIFTDENDKMNLSVLDVSGGVLAISNFTLLADTKKGNRPSFFNALEPNAALKLYDYFCECLKSNGINSVQKGEFGTDMKVDLLNDGPVTIILNTELWKNENRNS